MTVPGNLLPRCWQLLRLVLRRWRGKSGLITTIVLTLGALLHPWEIAALGRFRYGLSGLI